MKCYFQDPKCFDLIAGILPHTLGRLLVILDGLESSLCFPQLGVEGALRYPIVYKFHCENPEPTNNDGNRWR